MPRKKDVPLEVLVKTGDFESVKKYLKGKDISKEEKKTKQTEAELYYLANTGMGDWDVDVNQFQQFFEQHYGDYFNRTKNEDLIETLISSAYFNISFPFQESFASINSLTLFGVDSFSNAIKKYTKDSEEKKETISQIIEKGFYLIFNSDCSDYEEYYNAYFSAVVKWKELLSPEFVKEFILESREGEDNEFEQTKLNELMINEGDEQYKPFEVLKRTIQGLVDLSDRKLVSELLGKVFGENKNYQRLIEEGLIDKLDEVHDMRVIENTKLKDLTKLVADYEKEIGKSYMGDSSLREYLGKINNIVKENPDNSIKEFISQKMVDWFNSGEGNKLELFSNSLAKGLYNSEMVKTEIGKSMENLLKSGDKNGKLYSVFSLPEELIDYDNTKIKELVEVQKMRKKSSIQHFDLNNLIVYKNNTKKSRTIKPSSKKFLFLCK